MCSSSRADASVHVSKLFWHHGLRTNSKAFEQGKFELYESAFFQVQSFLFMAAFMPVQYHFIIHLPEGCN